MAPGTTAALGDGAAVYSRPGYVPLANGAMFGIAVPDDGARSATLAPITRAVVDYLTSQR